MSQGVCVLERVLHAHDRRPGTHAPLTLAMGNTLAETQGFQLWEPQYLVELPL